MPRPAYTIGVLVLGASATAWAAIFFRLAEGVPALTVAAYRLAISTVAMVAIAAILSRNGLAPLRSRRMLLLLALSGMFLAGHFWTWFLSLNRTSVGSSVVIVAMQPLVAGVLGYLFLRERPTRREAAGIALGVVGFLVIGGGDLLKDQGQLGGDLLAFAGAVLAASYRLIGRHVRPVVDTWVYSSVVYGFGAICLWFLVLALQPAVTGFEAKAWTFIVLLALVPQVIGHTAFNWALRHFRVVTISLVNMTEPIAATLIAIPLLNENPGGALILGAPLIIAGVILGLSGQSAAVPRTSRPGAENP